MNFECIQEVYRNKLYKTPKKKSEISAGKAHLMELRVLIAINTSAHRLKLGGTPILSETRPMNNPVIKGQEHVLFSINREWVALYIQ